MTTAQDNAALFAAVLNVSNTWKYMITERESNTSVGNEATSVRREAKTLSSSCCQFKEIDAKVMNCSSSSSSSSNNNNNNNNNNRDSGHSKSKKRSKYVANKRLKRPRKKPSPDSSSVETETTLTSSDQNVSLLGAVGGGSSGESVLDKESEEGSGASVEYARSGDSDEDTGGISGFDFETGGEEDSEHQTEGDEVVDSLDGNFYAKDFIGKEKKGDTEKERDSKTDVIADDYGKMTDAESKTWKEKDMKTESEGTKSGSEEEEGKVTKNDSEGTKSGSEEEGKGTLNDSEGTKSGSEEEEGKVTKNDSGGTKSGSEEEEGKVTKNDSEGTKSGSEEEEGKDTKNDSEDTESESQEEGKDMKNDSEDTEIGSEEGRRPKLEKLNEKEPGIEDKSEFSEEDETHERKFEEWGPLKPRKPTTPRKQFVPESKSFGDRTTESKHLDNTKRSNEHYRNSVESKDTTTENEQVEVSATVISSEESTASDDPYVQPITDSEPNEGVARSEMFFSEMVSTARDTTRSTEKTGPTTQSEPIFMETPEVPSSPEIESHAENSTDIKPTERFVSLDSIFGKPQPRSESYEEDYSMSESELTEVPTSESESDSVESVLVCEPSEEPTAMSMQHTKQLEIGGIEESGTEREKMENSGAKRELHKNRVRISRPVQLPIQESESHPQSETDDFEDESHVELSERYRTDLNDEDDVVDVGDRAGLDYGGGTIVDTGGADFDVTRGRQCSEHS